MTIQVFRDEQLLGNFEEGTIQEALTSGFLRKSDSYFFAGMAGRRTLEDFVVKVERNQKSLDKQERLIRIHRDPARSRRESKRNDVVLLTILAGILLIGFCVIVYNDVNAKKERRAQLQMERARGYSPSSQGKGLFLRGSGVSTAEAVPSGSSRIKYLNPRGDELLTPLQKMERALGFLNTPVKD